MGAWRLCGPRRVGRRTWHDLLFGGTTVPTVGARNDATSSSLEIDSRDDDDDAPQSALSLLSTITAALLPVATPPRTPIRAINNVQPSRSSLRLRRRAPSAAGDGCRLLEVAACRPPLLSRRRRCRGRTRRRQSVNRPPRRPAPSGAHRRGAPRAASSFIRPQSADVRARARGRLLPAARTDPIVQSPLHPAHLARHMRRARCGWLAHARAA